MPVPKADVLRWLYVGQGLTGPQIATQAGVSVSAVYKALRAAAIPTRPTPYRLGGKSVVGRPKA